MKPTKLFIFVTFLLAFGLQVSAQINPYPNELKGYDFFGNGKLKRLKLGVSTKKDIKKIFGESCEKFCNYDENFKIKFEYLAALDDCMTTEDIRDRVMCPQKQFVDRVSSIKLEPKQQKIVSNLLTSEFNIFRGGGYMEKGSEVSVSFTSFADKYGLRYSINNESFGKLGFHYPYPATVNGNLYSIEYIFTDDFIRKAFTVEYMTRRKELKK